MKAHIAIAGSKSYPRPDLVQAYVECLRTEAVIVSGGTAGVDTFAEEAAKARGLKILVFHADWK